MSVSPGFTLAGSAEGTGLWAAGSGRGGGRERAGPMASRAPTPPTSERVPISVPPLTNQIHPSLFWKQGRVLDVYLTVKLPWGKGQSFLPNCNALDFDNCSHRDLIKI